MYPTRRGSGSRGARPRPRSTDRSTAVSGSTGVAGAAANGGRGAWRARQAQARTAVARRAGVGRIRSAHEWTDGGLDLAHGGPALRRCLGAAEVTTRRLAFTSRFSQSSSSDANTGPSRQTRCGVPGGRHHHAAEACAHGATHVLLHRHLQERLAPRLRGAGGDRPPSAALPTQARDAEPVAPGRRLRGQGAEHRQRPAREGLVGPRLVLGDEVRDEAVMPDGAVVGRDDVLDLVRQQRRGIDVSRARAAEQQRDLPAGPDGLVGQRPDAGDSEPARDEQDVLRPRVDLERAARAARACRPGRPGGAG